MQQESASDVERRQEYAELISLVTRTFESLQAKDEITAINAERLKTVVDVTREIKEQLILMNGRVRQNEKDLAVAKANPSLTREHCDIQRGKLDERLRAIEEKTPAIIQNLAVAITTGGVMTIGGYLLSKLP